MSTDRLGLATRLIACTSRRVFTFTRTVAHLLAKMSPALELLAADLTTTSILEPALYVLEILLAAHAALLYQEWALRAGFIIKMAVVLDLGVATALGSITLKATRWWLSTAR